MALTVESTPRLAGQRGAGGVDREGEERAGGWDVSMSWGGGAPWVEGGGREEDMAGAGVEGDEGAAGRAGG